MKILFAYIEDYRCLKDVQLNFDSQYRFRYDKARQEVFVEPGERPLPADFFSVSGGNAVDKGCVEAVSAIVGSNGSGKTSVARFLVNFFAPGVEAPCNYVVVLGLGDGQSVCCYRKSNGEKASAEWDLNSMPMFQVDVREVGDNYAALFADPQFVYLTPHYTANSDAFDDGDSVADLSPSGLMASRPEYYANQSTGDEHITLRPVDVYETLQTEWMLKFVNEMNDKSRRDDSGPDWSKRTPLGVTLSVNETAEVVNRIHFRDERQRIVSRVRDEIDNALKSKGGAECSQARKAIQTALNKNAADQFEEKILRLNHEYERAFESAGLTEKVYRWSQEFAFHDELYRVATVPCRDLFVRAFRSYCLSYFNQHTSSIGWEKAFPEHSYFRGFHDRFVGLFGVKIDMDENLRRNDLHTRVKEFVVSDCFMPSVVREFFSTLQTLRVSDGQWRLPTFEQDQLDQVLRIVDCHIKLGTITPVLKFSLYPNMSAGELSLLRTFGRLYWHFRLRERNSELTKNVVLFFDEAETALHPGWQRELIRSMIVFFETFVPGIRAHLIFSTHSPILLSDIPIDNVVFLKKTDQGTHVLCASEIIRSGLSNTFAANIFDLYALPFFLEHGTMGMFATKKITEALNEVKCSHSSKILDMIGDKMIRILAQRNVVNDRRMMTEK